MPINTGAALGARRGTKATRKGKRDGEGPFRHNWTISGLFQISSLIFVTPVESKIRIKDSIFQQLRRTPAARTSTTPCQVQERTLPWYGPVRSGCPKCLPLRVTSDVLAAACALLAKGSRKTLASAPHVGTNVRVNRARRAARSDPQ